ncbi:hypothetical protein GCM10023063_44290 [Arthrobacter methylotrophus]
MQREPAQKGSRDSVQPFPGSVQWGRSDRQGSAPPRLVSDPFKASDPLPGLQGL